MLFLCQHGFERLLEGELASVGVAARSVGPGWAAADPMAGDSAVPAAAELCFPHLILRAPQEVRGGSVNALAQGLADFLLTALRGERVEVPWPCVFREVAEVPGLGRRAAAVEKALQEVLERKLRRVARLALPTMPPGSGPTRGLAVFAADFDRFFAAREFWRGGQRRMADDPLAPSRSYLKVEEAYGVLGREPAPSETVCDLGAAPGGWSYSAAKRGARVVAVDNGPLKGGALGHPGIEHRREDAFRFAPSPDGGFDWMFCDLVEDPQHVLHDLVTPWLERGWCRRFVVNLKFGRADPLALLRLLRAPGGVLARRAPRARIRHLLHDREELTIVGEVAEG